MISNLWCRRSKPKAINPFYIKAKTYDGQTQYHIYERKLNYHVQDEYLGAALSRVDAIAFLQLEYGLSDKHAKEMLG